MSPEEFRSIVREEIAAAEARILAEFRVALAQLELRARSSSRDIEVKIDTALNRQIPAQARLNTAQVTIADLLIRMSALEDRMLSFETQGRPQ